MADSQPDEVAEVDFGRLRLIFDPETGKNRVHHALIVALRYGRHQYVHILPNAEARRGDRGPRSGLGKGIGALSCVFRTAGKY